MEGQKLRKFDILGNCPTCKATWKGEEIPKKYSECYSPDATHYSVLISVKDYTYGKERNYYQCPFCAEQFERI